MENGNSDLKCRWFECAGTHDPSAKDLFFQYCEYHKNGGIFSGESFDQYQIIEQDFIDFANSVPLASEHMEVHSPKLRDIIIRTCVQIEIFFKESAKNACGNGYCPGLLEKTRTGKGRESSRKWKFPDYLELFDSYFKHDRAVFVRQLNANIFPFDDWESTKEIPKWWNVYNSLKHSHHPDEKPYTYEIALNALAALFLLHCINTRSNRYLNNLMHPTVTLMSGLAELQEPLISSPFETRKFLFREGKRNLSTKHVIESNVSKKRDKY